MRVIFESARTPMVAVDPRSRKRFKGHGFLRVYAYEPGEPPPVIPGTNKRAVIPKRVAEWRAESGTGGRVVATPISQFKEHFGPIIIPESVLRELPEGATIEWRWRFEIGAP
jgi:hypothetical protein